MPKIGEIKKIEMNTDEFNNIMNSLQIPNKERDAYKKECLGESDSSVNIDQIQYLGNPEDMLKIKENADNANIKYDRIGHSNTSDNNMIIGCHIEKNDIDFSKISYSYANVIDGKFISKERIYDNVWPINLKYDLYENGIVRFYTENDKGEKTWYGWSKIEYCVDKNKMGQLMDIFKIKSIGDNKIDENIPKIEYYEIYYENGKIKKEKGYNSDEELVKEIDYFETGGISYIKEKGVETWYYPDGNIDEIYIDDEMIDISFYQDGQIDYIRKDDVELEYKSINVIQYKQDAIFRKWFYEKKLDKIVPSKENIEALISEVSDKK